MLENPAPFYDFCQAHFLWILSLNPIESTYFGSCCNFPLISTIKVELMN